MLSHHLLLGWDKQLLLEGTIQYRRKSTVLALTGLWWQGQPRGSDCSSLLTLSCRSTLWAPHTVGPLDGPFCCLPASISSLCCLNLAQRHEGRELGFLIWGWVCS